MEKSHTVNFKKIQKVDLCSLNLCCSRVNYNSNKDCQRRPWTGLPAHLLLVWQCGLENRSAVRASHKTYPKS